jgi:hypothetical protein
MAKFSEVPGQYINALAAHLESASAQIARLG